MYHRFNFYKNTFSIFHKTSEPSGFSKADYYSKHGSRYVFTDKGVYRCSNHWGRVGDCRWRLETIEYKQQTYYWGFAKWEDFCSNKENALLFFIEKAANGCFTCNHRSNTDNKNVILRTASETAKTLKVIKKIQTDTLWAKYLEYDDYETLKHYFINKLINSSKTYHQIKKEYTDLKNKN